MRCECLKCGAIWDQNVDSCIGLDVKVLLALLAAIRCRKCGAGPSSIVLGRGADVAPDPEATAATPAEREV